MSHFRLLFDKIFVAYETFKSRDALKIFSLQHSILAPFLCLTFNPSPLQLKPISSPETEIQARNFSHIPWLRTSTSSAQAEASPASADPAFQERNVLSVYISASQS